MWWLPPNRAGGTAPFSGDIDAAGRIWGRGTVDTKGSLMWRICRPWRNLLKENWQPDVDV